MAQDQAEEGYVGAKIDQQDAFDAGAYSFFGDMAPLDEGLGGALEDGLDAPPEEFPAQGALEDEDDLPIEALMDEDEEDEDLSLAALLRRQMLMKEGHQDAGSSSKVQQQQPLQKFVSTEPRNGLSKDAAQVHQQHQPLMPPLPPQPQLLSHLGQHSSQQQQMQSHAAAAVPGAGDLVSAGPTLAQLQSSQPPAAAERPAAVPAAPMSLADLEARMLSSANQSAEPQQLQSSGQLLSMLQNRQPQQRQAPQLQALAGLPGHPQLVPGPLGLPGTVAQGALGQLPPASIPLGPPLPFPGPAGGPLPPPGNLEALASLQQQQLQRVPMVPPPGYAGLPPPPMGPPFGPGIPPHMPPPPHMAAGQMPPPHLGPPHPGLHPGIPPHPGMLPPHMPGLGPPPFMGPDGAPPRGPPLPGQLAARGGIPPGFPGAPPPHLQQPPPGFQKPALPDGIGVQPPPQQQQLQQQPQQQGPAGPQHAVQPVQQSPGRVWGPRPAPAGSLTAIQQQQQHEGSPMRPRHPSPGSVSSAAFGGGYDPSIAGPGSVANVMTSSGGAAETPAQLVHSLRMQGSEMMAADEINYILRIQHMATHGGHPYLEDFYYQAFLNKYYGGRNALVFAPAELRDLEDTTEATEPRFADLSGLGKIVISNIRTPKMLMDVGSGPNKGPGAVDGHKAGPQQGAEGKTRPLEQEPMLAARIMIEDCMLLLSDVEDIDRMFAAAAAAANAPPGAPVPSISPSQAQTLLHRRSALLDGIAASFRLPDTPVLPADADSAVSAGGDGVFLRLMRLPKGRALVGKTLRLMFSAPPAVAAKVGKAADTAAALENSKSRSTAAGLDVIWALLRNAEAAFGPAVAAAAGGEADRRMTDATVGLAAAAGEMIKRLTKPEEAAACLAAAAAGLEAAVKASGQQLLPLFPAGRVPADTSPEWLGSVVASLLLRASELGLGSFAAAGTVKTLGEGYQKGEAEKAAELELMQEAQATSGAAAAVAGHWQSLLGRFAELVMLHLWALVQAMQAGGSVAAGGVSVDISPFVQKLACVPLIRVLMAHCDDKQQEQLRSYLSALK